MKGIIVKCEALYFVTFRKPSSTSLMLTFTVPPFTTVRGMIANALGLQQHDHSLQGEIKLGIRLIHPGYRNREMAKILKLKESTLPQSRAYPSSPMFKEYLVTPKYECYVGGECNKIEEIRSAFLDLQRPLYLGQSDDLIDVEVSDMYDLEEIETREVHSVVEVIHQNCTIEKVPYCFLKDGSKYSVEYKLISIPNNSVITQEKTKVYKIDGKNISLL